MTRRRGEGGGKEGGRRGEGGGKEGGRRGEGGGKEGGRRGEGGGKEGGRRGEGEKWRRDILNANMRIGRVTQGPGTNDKQMQGREKKTRRDKRERRRQEIRRVRYRFHVKGRGLFHR